MSAGRDAAFAEALAEIERLKMQLADRDDVVQISCEEYRILHSRLRTLEAERVALSQQHAAMVGERADALCQLAACERDLRALRALTAGFTSGAMLLGGDPLDRIRPLMADAGNAMWHLAACAKAWAAQGKRDRWKTAPSLALYDAVQAFREAEARCAPPAEADHGETDQPDR